MNKLLGLFVVANSIYAMDRHEKPQALVELAAQQVAKIILSHDPEIRARYSGLLNNPVPWAEDPSRNVGRAIVQQKPTIITPHTEQCSIPHTNLMTPATKSFDLVSFSPNGSKLAARIQGRGFMGLAIFDTTQAHKRIFFFEGFRESPAVWSPDNKTIAAIDISQRPCLFDYATQHFFNLCPIKTICSPCFHPSGKTALTATENIIYTWDLDSNKTEPFFIHGHPQEIIPLAYTQDGNKILTRGADALQLLSAVNGSTIQHIPARRDNLASAIMTSDGRFIITCQSDGFIRYWDSSTGQCLYQWYLDGKINSASMSHDEKTIACVGFADILHLIDIRISHCIKHLRHTVEGFESHVYSADFHPDGQQLATGGTKVIGIWDLRTFNILKEYLIDKLSTEQATCLATIQGLSNPEDQPL